MCSVSAKMLAMRSRIAPRRATGRHPDMQNARRPHPRYSEPPPGESRGRGSQKGGTSRATFVAHTNSKIPTVADIGRCSRTSASIRRSSPMTKVLRVTCRNVNDAMMRTLNDCDFAGLISQRLRNAYDLLCEESHILSWLMVIRFQPFPCFSPNDMVDRSRRNAVLFGKHTAALLSCHTFPDIENGFSGNLLCRRAVAIPVGMVLVSSRPSQIRCAIVFLIAVPISRFVLGAWRFAVKRLTHQSADEMGHLHSVTGKTHVAIPFAVELKGHLKWWIATAERALRRQCFAPYAPIIRNGIVREALDLAPFNAMLINSHCSPSAGCSRSEPGRARKRPSGSLSF